MTAGATTLAGTLVIGCGGGTGSGTQPAALLSGTTGQDLAVNADRVPGRLTITWRPTCRSAGRPSKAGFLPEPRVATFPIRALPTLISDTADEGADEISEDARRVLQVRADRGGIAGTLRVRSRIHDLVSGELNSTCDTGVIAFRARPVDTPTVPEVAAPPGELARADLAEGMYDARKVLAAATGDGRVAEFCALITVRLAQRLCRESRRITSRRLLQDFQDVDPDLAPDEVRVRRAGDAAILVVSTYVGSTRRTLRFEQGADRRWRLDAVGPPRRGQIP